MKQQERILRHMNEMGPITPLDAMKDLGCMRLAARIGELVKLGHAIDSDMVQSRNRWGEFTSFKRYWLRHKPPQPKPLRKVFAEEPQADIPAQTTLFPDGDF